MSNSKERIFIIIDGSNFYHRLKELGLKNLLDFDYKKFGEFLTGDRQIVSQKYYIGAIREESGNPKSKRLMQGQMKLVSRLRKYGWEIGFGQMLKTDDYHEKGVDVLMAVDILVGAYEDLYDGVVLVSSDTDLIPAIEKVRKMQRKVEYIGFSSKPSYGLIANTDVRRLFVTEDMAKFIETK